MLSVTHIMPVLALLSVAGVGMQQCMIRNRNEMHKLSKVKNRQKYAFFSGACWQQPYNADNKCTAAGVTLHQFDALCTANVKVFMQSE